MFEIFKNLFKHWKLVIIVVALLAVQAYCDLALPQYTSDIIDTGIQNGGLTSVVPVRIQADEYNKVQLFMTEEERDLWTSAYDGDADGDGIYERVLKDSELKDFGNSILPAIMINYQMQAVPFEEFKATLWTNPQVQVGMMMQGLTEDDFMAMPVEELQAMMGSFGMGFDVFQKDIEDADGNMVATDCVDMRVILGGMMESGAMNNASIEQARDVFQEMSDTIGTSTLKAMGMAWARECEGNAGIDLDKKQTDYLWSSAFKMLAMALLIMVCSIVISYFAAIVGGRIGRDLREKVFGKVLSFSNKEIDQFSTASLITRSTNDVQQVQMVSTMLLRMMFYAPILGVGGVIKVIKTGAGMGWTIALAVTVIMTIVLSLMSFALPKFKLMQKLVDNLNLVSRELLTGISVIRAFGREESSEERFDKANTELMSTQLFTSRVMSLMMPLMMFVMYGFNILIVWVAAHKIDEGLLQVGKMTAFLTYAIQIVMSFLMLTMMSIVLPRAGVAADRIKEVCETMSSIKDKETTTKIDDVKGVVEFNHVNFRYPNADEDVLVDIHFKAEPGKTTAIIGSTGSGKSTLVNLIPRLYDISSGSITVDGVDVRDLKLEELREFIGFVPQKAVLFSGTIESNMQFGKEDASEQEILEATDIAQATEFINGKDEKLKSAIAQGGSNVSGGQKQRLAIARAIVKNPDIFIFDDSFSALDMKTDAALRKALAEKAADKTVIIVAQRISTILKADQIIALEDGKIAGIGTHQELMRTCEIYQEIARSQLSEKEINKTMDVKEGV